MILKLRVNIVRGINNPDYSIGWELISDIISFRYSKVNKEFRDKKDLRLNDYIQWRDKKGKVDEVNQNYVYIQAWHKRANDEPINIVTNMPAYMLNDEGKTIEKIN